MVTHAMLSKLIFLFTHACKHTRIHARAHTHTHTHIHIHARARTHAETHTRAGKDIRFARSRTLVHAHARA